MSVQYLLLHLTNPTNYLIPVIVEKKSFLYHAVNINAKSSPASHWKLETFLLCPYFKYDVDMATS